MDGRFAGAMLVGTPAVLLTTYFFKVPYGDVSWCLAGGILGLLLGTFVILLLHNDETLSDQVLILHRKRRRTDSFLRVVCDPRSNLLLWFLGAVLGSYTALHASMIWTAYTTLPWRLMVPLAAYSAACPMTLVVMLGLQYIRWVQDFLFDPEDAMATYQPAQHVLFRVLSFAVFSEVVGVFAAVYIGSFITVFSAAFMLYENIYWIIDTEWFYYGWRICAGIVAVSCVLNCAFFIAIRSRRRRRRMEEERREQQGSSLTNVELV